MKVLLVQLPIPKINFGLNTGNIPLGAACLKQAAATIPGCRVDILQPDLASHAGDRALVSAITARTPDIVGFTVFSWNRDRSVHLAREIKRRTGAAILFGGPEITEETVRDLPDLIDRCIIGEGESAFRQILEEKLGIPGGDLKVQGAVPGSRLSLGSPYVNGHLALGHDRVMLLETQRGCPYHCGFCYYSKARKKRDVADDESVLEGLAWALTHGAKEIYLMDPSLNARPGLARLLEDIARLNRTARVPLISEIRAESVTAARAERYAAAGFTAFEVGLQSINPKALEAMNRPTRLDRFLTGVRALKDAGIAPTIDLIFGLPGDTPEGFRQTVDFILEKGLSDEVQVFPLLVLPGTAFRADRQALGLVHESHPPYPVIRTPGFSENDLEAALDYAEDRLDRAFFPFPDLSVSFIQPGSGRDHYLTLEGVPHLAKLVLDRPRSAREIEALGERICSPLQIFFGGSALDETYMQTVLHLLSGTNPFVPMEAVFLFPDRVPDTEALLAALATPRPHFLDLDQRWLYPEPGNRSLLFTLVSGQDRLVFTGPMRRQVFHWSRRELPGLPELDALSRLDGILIDAPGDGAVRDNAISWQDRMAGQHEAFLPVCFADLALQRRWLSLTEGERYQMPVIEAAASAGS